MTKTLLHRSCVVFALLCLLALVCIPARALSVTLDYQYNGEGVSDLTTKLTVSKIDQNHLYVVGAKMAIYEEGSDTPLVTWVTTGSDVTYDRYLNEGVPLNIDKRYVVKELQAPEGYEKAADTTFYIDKYGKVVVVDGANSEAVNNNQINIVDAKLMVEQVDYVTRETPAQQTPKDSNLAHTGDYLVPIVLLLGLAAVGSLTIMSTRVHRFRKNVLLGGKSAH